MSFVRAFNKHKNKYAKVKHPRKYTKPDDTLTAVDILDSSNHLHKQFLKWCGSNEPTKRKARQFLAGLKNNTIKVQST